MRAAVATSEPRPSGSRYANFRKLVLGVAATASLCAQNQPILGEDTVKVSEHVWAIMGFPNIGIVVGTNATLVVDTGLGPRNGATIAKVAGKLAPGHKLYLTTPHFHPEHAAGEPGFPPGTILIRDRVQQEEMEKHGQEMIDMFAGRSEQQKALLADVNSCVRRTRSSTKNASWSWVAAWWRACCGLAALTPKATS